MLCEDWEGAAPRQAPQTAAQRGQPDYVRPGRFMATLRTMRTHLEAMDAQVRVPSGGVGQGGMLQSMWACMMAALP